MLAEFWWCVVATKTDGDEIQVSQKGSHAALILLPVFGKLMVVKR
jgi:hypothetical protein